MNQQAFWGAGNEQMTQMLSNGWAQALKAFQNMPGAPAAGTIETQTPVTFDQDRLRELQQQYMQESMDLWRQSAQGALTSLRDKRFSASAWQQNPLAAFAAASYMLNAKTMMGLAEAVVGDEKTRARIRFGVEQWMAAMAPSNFLAFNAEAQQKAIETKGQSLAQGIQNLLNDLRQGHVSMTDESQFEVGKNVATTEGAVVYENELFQLIEYKPLTTQVYERPLLFVPPCINKFYILDLQPDNSLIRYAVSQGHRTFVVSWRNPDEGQGNQTWDDYIENAVIRAIEVAKDISGQPQINTLGFCVGGTMLVNALGVLAARGDDSVASTTLLTTLVDFSDTGVLDVFIDEAFVRFREMSIGNGGLMRGQELASTFSFLRPVDLVWNYVVGNYLKGETPPPFDLLYWNSDCTNLPGPYFASYLRNFYLENRLIEPGGVTVCGEQIDLSKIKVPMYLYGSREDHIVPIGGAYASTQVFKGRKRFVMGASGHIAGVINPPSKNKRSHWLREDNKFPASVDEWIAGADEYPGSWWTDWAEWLQKTGGKKVAAPKSYGAVRKYKAKEPAPGSYVLQRA